jgi:hypothetical protein
MNFTIAQNSNLPILKLQVVKDGIEDYNSMMEFIERSSIFFSMVDTLTGIPKIYSKTARFVEKLGLDPNASPEYYVYYKFTTQDTNRVGRYEGQFVFINDTSSGNILTILTGSTLNPSNINLIAGTLVLPIREPLFINVVESNISNDLPYDNCYVLEYNCCVTPFPSPLPSQTPYPKLSNTPTPTPTPTNTPTLTPTPTPTNTPTLTPTPTPTPTSVIEILINPIITENGEYIDVGGNFYLMFVDPPPQELINPLIVGNDEYLIIGDEEYLEFVDPI